MSYLNSVEKAINYIEAEMRNNKTDVSAICEHAGVSKWYFQRIFKGVTGDTVGDYLRKRRLSLAAIDLVNTDRAIIDIAFDFGFESQEAFTRSFKKLFENTPGQFRKNRDPKMFKHKFHLTSEFLQHLKEKLKMEPVIEEREELKLVGFSAPFRGVFDENPNNDQVIPGLWQKLMQQVHQIKNQVEGEIFGVVDCKMIDGNEKLEYRAMVQVNNFDAVPEGMDSFIFPKGKLAKFTHKGSLDGIDKTVKYALGTWLPQTNYKLREGLELEIYPCDFNPQDPNSSFEYCLALS